VLIATLSKSGWFLLYWTAFSLIAAAAINFVLADKAQLYRRERIRLYGFLFRISGLIALGLWVILCGAMFGLKSMSFVPTTWLWLPPALGLLAVGFAYLHPWQSRKWIGLTIFAHGAF